VVLDCNNCVVRSLARRFGGLADLTVSIKHRWIEKQMIEETRVERRDVTADSEVIRIQVTM
jgi:hypothetical protein